MESYRISFWRNWLIPLGIMLLSLVQDVAWHSMTHRIFFLLKQNGILLYGEKPHLVYHSSKDEHLSCFHLMALVTRADMNRCVQISFRDPAFNSFAYISRSGITRSYGSSINEYPYCFPQLLYHFTIPPAVYKCPKLYTVLSFYFIFWLLGRWDLSSLSRDQTCASPLETQSLNHWTIREVPSSSSLYFIFF